MGHMMLPEMQIGVSAMRVGTTATTRTFFHRDFECRVAGFNLDASQLAILPSSQQTFFHFF